MNKRVKYGAEYISYLESGESAAVIITRDIVNSINTANKWIDVLELHTYNTHGQRAFYYFIVEVFDRKIKPSYPKQANIEDKKYITWKTANQDIEEQRNKGVNGPKYLVLSNLNNKNKGKYTTKQAVWNKTFNRWVLDAWFTPSCEYRMKRIYEEPEWDYYVLNVKKVTNKQVNFIKKHESEIINKISKNRKPKLEFFQLNEKPSNN